MSTNLDICVTLSEDDLENVQMLLLLIMFVFHVQPTLLLFMLVITVEALPWEEPVRLTHIGHFLSLPILHYK